MEEIIGKLTESDKYESNQFKSQFSEHDIKDTINLALEKDHDEKVEILWGIVQNYFSHYGYIVPKSAYNELFMNSVVEPKTKEEITQAIMEAGKWAFDYITHDVKKHYIGDVTIKTIRKIIRNTFYGDRLKEMSPSGDTVEDLKQGFIYSNVLTYLTEQVLKQNDRKALLYEPSVFKVFTKEGDNDKQTINRISFIRSKLREIK